MKLLLDTHIWLWSLLAPERLVRRVAGPLGNPLNELWLSPITLWEVMVLARKGRITLDAEPEAWLRTVLRDFHFREAPINHEVAIVSQRENLALKTTPIGGALETRNGLPGRDGDWIEERELVNCIRAENTERMPGRVKGDFRFSG